jgi:hypothetical protein
MIMESNVRFSKTRSLENVVKQCGKSSELSQRVSKENTRKAEKRRCDRRMRCPDGMLPCITRESLDWRRHASKQGCSG